MSLARRDASMPKSNSETVESGVRNMELTESNESMLAVLANAGWTESNESMLAVLANASMLAVLANAGWKSGRVAARSSSMALLLKYSTLSFWEKKSAQSLAKKAEEKSCWALKLDASAAADVECVEVVVTMRTVGNTLVSRWEDGLEAGDPCVDVSIRLTLLSRPNAIGVTVPAVGG